MPQWGVNDAASNSVLWGVSNHKKVANAANRTAFFGNVTAGVFDNNAGKAVGQFGVNAAEIGATAGPAHTGWVERTEGLGQLSSITINDGGTLYDNADTIAVTADTGSNGAANVVTDANGTITSIVISSAGGLYKASPTVTVTTSNGVNASLTAVVGGRAGRVNYETLVAVAITGDASDDTQFPDS